VPAPAPATAPTPAPTGLQRPLRDLAAWVEHFQAADLPVLAETAATLEELRAVEDEVDAHLLADSIGGDPLMALKILSHVAELRMRRRQRDDGATDTETVTEALVLLGIGPFFRAFGPQASAEDRLRGCPAALEGLLAVVARSHRAAAFALGFAVHRMDHDAPVIHLAAQLHSFGEMLLWLEAPALALEIAARQKADSTLRSATVQREVLGVTLHELQHALMTAWRLPELLVHISDERHVHAPQVRNVTLAVRLARHTARGWDNAALPDDLYDIAELLNLSETPTLKLLREIDAA
jgi:hypothetical protein